MKWLDVGSGRRNLPGATSVDIDPATSPDVVHDLDRRPWPFETSEFDGAWLDNVLEHLDDVVATLDEVHRVVKPNGEVVIHVPYFRSRYAAVDPTHKHAFTVSSMDYFDVDHEFHSRYGYGRSEFRVRRLGIDDRFEHGLLLRTVARLARRRPVLYEAKLSHLVPLNELTFVLEVVK